jgi:hypothetical protein
MTSVWGIRILVSAVVAAVVAAIVVAIAILGSPSVQRKRKLDQRRVQDLITIEGDMSAYWHRHDTLPPDLVTLTHEGFRTPTSDPERGNPYGFTITGTDSYRLCADFSFDSKEDPQPWYYSPRGERSWAHGQGRQCFDLTVQRDKQ